MILTDGAVVMLPEMLNQKSTMDGYNPPTGHQAETPGNVRRLPLVTHVTTDRWTVKPIDRWLTGQGNHQTSLAQIPAARNKSSIERRQPRITAMVD